MTSTADVVATTVTTVTNALKKMSITQVEGPLTHLIGSAAGAGIGLFLGFNVYFIPTMVLDGLAQLTELCVDCVIANDGTRCEICCGRNRKSIRRRKNCCCCDCTRTVLFGVAPGIVGGVIDFSTFLGALTNELANFQDMIIKGKTLPRNFGYIILMSNFLQLLINYPLSFCLHHRGVNSYRFALASLASMAIRGVYHIKCVVTGQFAWESLILSQVLGYYFFSLMLYWESDTLNKKLIPFEDEGREHYHDEPDWELHDKQDVAVAPVVVPAAEPQPAQPADDKQWWQVPFAKKGDPTAEEVKEVVEEEPWWKKVQVLFVKPDGPADGQPVTEGGAPAGGPPAAEEKPWWQTINPLAKKEEPAPAAPVVPEDKGKAKVETEPEDEEPRWKLPFLAKDKSALEAAGAAADTAKEAVKEEPPKPAEPEAKAPEPTPAAPAPETAAPAAETPKGPDAAAPTAAPEPPAATPEAGAKAPEAATPAADATAPAAAPPAGN